MYSFQLLKSQEEACLQMSSAWQQLHLQLGTHWLLDQHQPQLLPHQSLQKLEGLAELIIEYFKILYERICMTRIAVTANKNKAATARRLHEQRTSKVSHRTHTLQPYRQVKNGYCSFVINYNIRFFPWRNTKRYISLREVEESITLYSLPVFSFYDKNLDLRFFISTNKVKWTQTSLFLQYNLNNV